MSFTLQLCGGFSIDQRIIRFVMRTETKASNGTGQYKYMNLYTPTSELLEY